MRRIVIGYAQAAILRIFPSPAVDRVQQSIAEPDRQNSDRDAREALSDVADGEPIDRVPEPEERDHPQERLRSYAKSRRRRDRPALCGDLLLVCPNDRFRRLTNATLVPHMLSVIREPCEAQ